jgi:hypothetical protein
MEMSFSSFIIAASMLGISEIGNDRPRRDLKKGCGKKKKKERKAERQARKRGRK